LDSVLKNQGEDTRLRSPGLSRHDLAGRSLGCAPPAPPARHGAAAARHCQLGAEPSIDFAAAWAARPVRPTSADMATRAAAAALQIAGPGTGERGVLTHVVSRKLQILVGRNAPCRGLGGSSQQVEEPALLRQQNYRCHAVGASWRGE